MVGMSKSNLSFGTENLTVLARNRSQLLPFGKTQLVSDLHGCRVGGFVVTLVVADMGASSCNAEISLVPEVEVWRELPCESV